MPASSVAAVAVERGSAVVVALRWVAVVAHDSAASPHSSYLAAEAVAVAKARTGVVHLVLHSTTASASAAELSGCQLKPPVNCSKRRSGCGRCRIWLRPSYYCREFGVRETEDSSCFALCPRACR